MHKEERLIIVKKTSFKRKSLSLSLKSLALALGLTAATSTTSFAMPVKEAKTIESHEHNHDHDSIEEITAKNTEINNTQRVYKLINIKEVRNFSISNYRGVSIVEALNLCNINSSFSNRKAMASNYGIKNYRGTSSQNILLLKNLKNDDVKAVAKVSDIVKICNSLFGKDSYKVIRELKLPRTSNITKSEFARMTRIIANNLGVNTSTYDDRLELVKNVINDVNSETINSNDIAWSYYMGYTDLDNELNYNGNALLSVDELNHWIRTFTNDYNMAINNNNYSDNGLVIVPSAEIYERDINDLSKINGIRNPQSGNKKPGNTDNNTEKHIHKYSSWKYLDKNTEISVCNDCGTKKYQGHKLSNNTKVIYQSNNDGTHKTIKSTYCNSCHTTIKKESMENCSLSNWIYNSETKLEERKCNNCGYTETRVHEHEEPTNLVYNFYQSNNDGTHKLKATYECSKCNEILEFYKDVNCSLSEWTYNSETKLEERKCDVCGYTETRVHEHQQPDNLTYVLDRKNYDGTHKLKATYNCDTCSSVITLYKDEECEFGVWQQHDGSSCKSLCIVCSYEKFKEHKFIVVQGSITSNPILGKHNITKECDDCNYTKQEEENCISDGNRYYYRNGEIVTERENCSICNDVCIDDAHTHNYGSYIIVDDNEHKRVCDCEHELVESHNYGEWILNNGQNTRECGDCHNIQTVEHVCSLTTTDEFPSTKNKDYCYLRVTTCNVDGCNYRVIESQVPHNYIIESNPFGATYECDRCGYYYSEEFLSVLPTLKYYKKEEDEIIEEEKSKILVLK